MINFFTSKSRSMLFTQKLARTRVILDDQGIWPVGLYILAGREVKMVMHGNSETVETLKTEADCVHALVKYFGMHFRNHELGGIIGLSSHINTR